MTDNPAQLENKPNLRELGRPVVIAWLDYHGINLPVAKAVDLMERIGAAINSRAPVVGELQNTTINCVAVTPKAGEKTVVNFGKN